MHEMCTEVTAVQYTFIVFMSTRLTLYLRTQTYTHTCARKFTTVRSVIKELRR